MVSTSAGIRCPECAYVRTAQQATTVDNNGSLGMAAVAGLITGITGAYVMVLFAYAFPALPLLASPLCGRLVADAVKSFCDKKTNAVAAPVGAGSILIGSLIALGLPLSGLSFMHGPLSDAARDMVGLAIGLSALICYHRLKPRPS